MPNIYDRAFSAKKGHLFSRKIFIVDVSQDLKYAYTITYVASRARTTVAETYNPKRQVVSGKNPASIYLFKVINRNTIKRCEICSKSKIKTLEKC